MLDIIRRNSQSMWVKVVFALIIIVFVFWGASAMDGGGQGTIAKVNGTPINSGDFITMFRFEANAIRNNPQYAGNWGPEQEKILSRDIISKMVLRLALTQEAQKLGIGVSDEELSHVITNDPMFRGANGRFDENAYQTYLKMIQIPVGRYESMIIDDLLLNKVRSYITSAISIPEDTGRKIFDYEAEKRSISYVLFPYKSYMADVKLQDDEIAAYYEANKSSFTRPAHANLEFLSIPSESLIQGKTYTDDAIKDYYEEYKDSLVKPARYEVRHILFLAPLGSATDEAATAAEVKAKDIITKLGEGASFAELAKTYSDDKSTGIKGGLVGWINPGETDPSFEKAAAELKKGEYSKEPVRSFFGYHVIMKDNEEKERQLTLAEAKESIVASLRMKDMTAASATAFKELEDNIADNKPLADIAAAYNAEVKETKDVPVDTIPGILKVSEDSIADLSNFEAGSYFPDVIYSSDGMVIFKIKSYTAALIPPLEEVKPRITATLTEEADHKLSLEAANAAAKTAAEEALPASLRGKVQVSTAAPRTSALEPLGFAPTLTQAVFSNPVGKWLGEGYSVKEGAVIAKVDNITPASNDEWANIKENYIAALTEARQVEFFAAYLNQLQKTADIVVYTDNPLGR